ncbi:MAG TPA: AAA family ATPase [Bacillota bacterium]|nr:AAA family ATPase [Bacillota bacterium]
MTTASAIFNGEPEKGLSIATAISVPGKGLLMTVEHENLLRPWESSTVFESALRRALSNKASYPYDEAVQMAIAMGGWNDGLNLLTNNEVDSLKLSMTYDTCSLLPEYIPFDEQHWLDQRQPIYRTLDHSENPRVKRVPGCPIAIVYQEGENFPELADDLKQSIRGALAGVEIDTYSGIQFKTKREGTLYEVFRQHRAVIFNGHLAKGPNDHWGWKLTDDDVLTMAELAKFLGVHSLKYPVYVPDLVFAHCCFSAGQDPVTWARPGLSYPKLFLDAGVMYFVGTARDVIFNDITIPQTIAREFMTAWVRDPDNAVQHLYTAKQKTGFHLLSGIYQIYTVGAITPSSGETRQPVSMASGIRAQDRLGQYVLQSELWSDPYAHTFWARHDQNQTSHMIQVLVDEWQHKPDLPEMLDKALKILQEANLGKGHLIPTRVEHAKLQVGDLPQSELYFLVYDRPGEDIEDWNYEDSHIFGDSPPEQSRQLLKYGLQLSNALAEMHEQKIIHGNLGPATVVVRRQGEKIQAMIRDAWVWQCLPGRCARPEYIAPEEEQRNQAIDEQKRDCWGLGLILRDAVKKAIEDLANIDPLTAPHLPEALRRVIQELQAPTPRLRPSADFVHDRLRLAEVAGGAYLGDFEQSLIEYILAGHRLFAVNVDDLDELEAILHGLMAQGHRLYVAREEVGLTDIRQNKVEVPWVSKNEVYTMLIQQARAQGYSDPPYPGDELVGRVNGQLILEYLASLHFAAVPAPVVLIRGARWWEYGQAGWRILRNIQNAPVVSPAVIVADHFLTLELDISRQFTPLVFPPPTPAALFEHILAFTKHEGLEDEISPEVTIELAEELYPISRREATQCLRMSLHRYGAIDKRILSLRDDSRKEFFDRLGIVRYHALRDLPQPGTVALTRELEQELTDWFDHIQHAEQEEGDSQSALRRILVMGSDRTETTRVAHGIATRMQRPLVSIDPASCLRGALGESEEMMHTALSLTGLLFRCVVLLDNVHGFMQNINNAPADSSVATQERMAGILLNWLDNLPPGCITILTAPSLEALPIQWRRRVERIFHIPSVTENMELRRRVFAAAFQRHGLSELVNDNVLTDELAAYTHPQNGISNLASPAALAASGPLKQHVIRLETATDIGYWVAETILLHESSGDPASPAFWRAALASLDQERRDI